MDVEVFRHYRVLFVDGCRQEKLHSVSAVWQLSRQTDDAVPRELPEQRAADVPVQPRDKYRREDGNKVVEG